MKKGCRLLYSSRVTYAPCPVTSLIVTITISPNSGSFFVSEILNKVKPFVRLISSAFYFSNNQYLFLLLCLFYMGVLFLSFRLQDLLILIFYRKYNFLS